MAKKYDWYWSLWNFGDSVPAPIARLQVLVKTLVTTLSSTAYYTNNDKTAIWIIVTSWILDFLLQGVCLEERIDNNRNDINLMGATIILMFYCVSTIVK